MKNPILQIGNTYHDAVEFRKVEKQANILKGNDLEFKKNESKKVIAICKDKKCK
jgi:hypothetical protein